MRRNILILLCSMMFGFGVTGCLMIPRALHMGNAAEPVRSMAWWSVMYEEPNPEHLPVQVHFQWLKGLE